MIIAGTILIELSTAKTETKSGLLLPPSMVMENNIGTVIETGKGKNPDMPQEVKRGDTVVFNHKSFRNKSFELEGRSVTLISQVDIFLINKN